MRNDGNEPKESRLTYAAIVVLVALLLPLGQWLKSEIWSSEVASKLDQDKELRKAKVTANFKEGDLVSVADLLVFHKELVGKRVRVRGDLQKVDLTQTYLSDLPCGRKFTNDIHVIEQSGTPGFGLKGLVEIEGNLEGLSVLVPKSIKQINKLDPKDCE
ncbi:hypothetical protein [Bdellovibrio svalbardensis]|uniref:Uncharacterized protein n=1 Tax=Bdellovibrio svalbardensis TaxID=2972972 RepID=A0ABT6DI15_9BACT|nr:hypothetical protein [Bdellovibrio svalbardensis]MDG0816490.1 hypothetical protein [Bdellovibrio svalbardensis]